MRCKSEQKRCVETKNVGELSDRGNGENTVSFSEGERGEIASEPKYKAVVMGREYRYAILRKTQ
jgi:hypothetical protein